MTSDSRLGGEFLRPSESYGKTLEYLGNYEIVLGTVATFILLPMVEAAEVWEKF
jgi:hypothetical protein